MAEDKTGGECCLDKVRYRKIVEDVLRIGYERKRRMEHGGSRFGDVGAGVLREGKSVCNLEQ